MTTRTEELLLAASHVQIQAAGKTQSVTIVACTGGQMVLSGWGPLVLDLAGVDVQPSLSKLFLNPTPAQRVSIISWWQCPNRVPMVRDQHDRDNLEGMLNLNHGDSLAETAPSELCCQNRPPVTQRRRQSWARD